MRETDRKTPDSVYTVQPWNLCTARTVIRVGTSTAATDGGGQMRRLLAVLAAVAMWSGAGYAQTPGGTPKFDAADISVRVRTGTTSQPGMTGGVLRRGPYDLR